MNANRLGELAVVWTCLCHSALASHGLVAHWTFDDGLTGSCGHALEAFDCDRDKLPMVDADELPGVCGRALVLGAGDANLHYLTTATTADLKPGPIYTLEAWIVPTRVDGWRRLLLLWGKAPQYAYHLALHDGRASLAHGQADGGFVIAEGGSAKPDCLNHLVGVADGAQVRVYLNGKQVASVSYDGTIADTGSMRIGVGDSAVIPSASNAFSGYLDELRIYNRALSADEVCEHFQTTQRGEAMKLSLAHSRVMLQRRLTAGLTDNQALLDELLARGVEQVVLARRGPGRDVQDHYYANFGYSSIRPDYWLHAVDGGQLISLDLKSREVRLLLDDPEGNVRDPHVHYDGQRILFSYRKGGTHYYNLYVIRPDGSGLTQLTDGPWDDIEPCWLPDGGIVFCSSRCKRYIGCWIAPSAILYRCDADGRNMRMLSTSPFSDNTPSVLPDGRILYTRWEYVNRDPVVFHHLWTMNPDGSATAAFLGNMAPGGVFIDARPIPDSDRIVFINSPGHGFNEHVGHIATFSPARGPNDRSMFTNISDNAFRDPFPLGDGLYLAARENQIVLIGEEGRQGLLYTAPDMVHEPVVVRPRRREQVIASRIDPTRSTGTVILARANYGRHMRGVEPGDVRKLLVLEDLPKPVNVHGGGSQPVGHGVTSTLKRILGTVPVEADGSAHFTVPAMRSLYFVLLDENDRSIKQMRSFTTLQPGERVTCIGCHETRTTAPGDFLANAPMLDALKREPSPIASFAGVPDILDFPRDIQPVLDRHCAECHNPDRREGGVDLCGDHGPVYSIAYYNLYLNWEIKDTAGDPRHGTGRQLGNDAPWTTYSYASDLMKKVDGSHYDVKLSDFELQLIRLWIDTGAAYPGTYACYGTGQIGDVWHNNLPVHEMADDWPSTGPCADAIERRCGGCHGAELLPRHVTARTKISAWGDLLSWTRPLSRYSRHRVFNLSRPEKSLALTVGLAADAGGTATEPLGDPVAVAEDFSTPPVAVKHAIVFRGVADADYQAILTHVRAAGARLREIKRFDMPGFRPGREYVREMRRYGILPPKSLEASDDTDPIDPYETDRRYWEMMYPVPRVSDREIPHS